MKIYDETGIGEAVTCAMQEKGLWFDRSIVKDSIKLLFESISNYLNDVREDENVKAVKLEERDFFFMAFIDNDGIKYSFDLADIKYGFNVVETSDSRFRNHIIESGIKHGIRFTLDIYIDRVLIECMKVVKKYINDNEISIEEFILMLEIEDEKEICETCGREK